MKVLITGGVGFIGANCAYCFAKQGHKVIIFDNLSRAGSEENLNWIKSTCSVKFVKGDLRKYEDITNVIIHQGPFELILHMAAQVAVTTSITNPREDFEINALGTFNLLEAIRQYNSETFLIYASTNKVYGEMKDLSIIEKNGRYKYKDLKDGVDERINLDFHSPYGCSKGAADQYCIDYARIYGLKTVVMRQSCIYGYRQFGIEDQGWVAWFCIAAVLGKKITIFGDGKQVRDVLFIDDLVNCYKLAYENRNFITGKAFNIGGGPENTISLHELIENLENLKGEEIHVDYKDWRPGDQKVFISDISLAEREFGWKPIISTSNGIWKLYQWVSESKHLFQ